MLLPISKCERHALKTARHISLGLYNIRSLNNKVDDVLEVLRDNKIDILLTVETWLDHDSVCLGRLRSCGFTVVDRPRPRTRLDSISVNHGGLAFIIAPGIRASRILIGFEPSTCEVLCVRISSGPNSCVIVLFYRTGRLLSRFFS